MNRLTFTLKAWPVIALATIGLCFLTKTVAGWLGIDLPDQQNIDVVRQYLAHAFDSARHFGTAAFLVAQVVVLLPAVEEVVFRLPTRWLRNGGWFFFSSALFAAAHYIAQPWPDAAFLALFFFGLAQCGLYRKTGRLWCAMLNHALFNLTNLVLLFILPET